jgi:tetratricopeptide (TPR) repeat protein
VNKNGKPLILGIPVMLHDKREISAFLTAKKRLEKWGADRDLPIQAGIFLYYFPKALSTENKEAQLVNQKRYRLPLINAQTPIHGINSLSYVYSDRGQLEETIEHCARLKEHDNGKINIDFTIDTHPGTLILPGLEEELPGVYSLEEFLQKRGELYERTKNRFEKLNEYARRFGFSMVLETICPVNFQAKAEGPGKNPRDNPGLYYYGFSNLENLVDISKGNMTMDIAHWGYTQALKGIVQANGEEGNRIKDIVFQIEEVKSWSEYYQKHPQHPGDYFKYSKVFHLSNSKGIGVNLGRWPQEAEKWGDSGRYEGTVTREQFLEAINYARENRIPVILEPDYDIKRIPENQFKEADEFLEYIL